MMEDVADKGSNDCRTQMSSVERLGNVRRRKLDNDLLVVTNLVASPTLVGFVDLLEQGALIEL